MRRPFSRFPNAIDITFSERHWEHSERQCAVKHPILHCKRDTRVHSLTRVLIRSKCRVVKIRKRRILSGLLNSFSQAFLFCMVRSYPGNRKMWNLIKNGREVKDTHVCMCHIFYRETSYHINPARRDRYFSRARSDKLVLLVRVSFDSSMSRLFSYFYLVWSLKL